MGKALGGFVIVVGLIVAAFSVLLNYLFGPIATMMVWFVFISLFLILVVLIQKPKGGGLSGAFGGAGGGSANDMLGAKAGDVLTWFTIGAFVCFLGMSIALTLTMLPSSVRAEARDAQAETTTQTDAPVDAGPAPAGPAGDEFDESSEMTHPSGFVKPQPIPSGDPVAEPVAPGDLVEPGIAPDAPEPEAADEANETDQPTAPATAE